MQKAQLMKFFQKPVETDIHELAPTTPNNSSDNLLNIEQNNVVNLVLVLKIFF